VCCLPDLCAAIVYTVLKINDYSAESCFSGGQTAGAEIAFIIISFTWKSLV